MNEKERLKKIHKAIKDAIIRREDFVKIENPETGKFVQLAIFRDKYTIVMDVPVIELTEEELVRLRHILNAEAARERSSNEPVSFQKLFGLADSAKVSFFVEKIFTEIFDLSADYEIAIEIFPR